MRLPGLTSIFVLSLFGLARSHPVHGSTRESNIAGIDLSRRQSTETVDPAAPATPTSTQSGVVPTELQVLADGNQGFRQYHNETTPTLLTTLTEQGQEPPFMFLGCSDSRASEGTIFNARPGTLFAARNIANQFQFNDLDTHAVLAYAVTALGVRHVIVMGHYGCGGVAAAIIPPPTSPDAATGVIQTWIDPIRQLFLSSTRPEIVELRQRVETQSVVEVPSIDDPGFRALVEENVKAGVRSIASDNLIADRFVAPDSSNTTSESTSDGTTEPAPQDLFIHGWVYDISNGKVYDLDVSVGPPGKPIPPTPFFDITITAMPATSNGSVNGTESTTTAS